jgi:hypothetical protein
MRIAPNQNGCALQREYYNKVDLGALRFAFDQIELFLPAYGSLTNGKA